VNAHTFFLREIANFGECKLVLNTFTGGADNGVHIIATNYRFLTGVVVYCMAGARSKTRQDGRLLYITSLI